MRYIQYQKNKYGDGEEIGKEKLMTLGLNKNKNLGTKYKWLEKLPRGRKNVALSAELEK